MLMAFGEEYLMIVLKTSATPNNIDSKRVDKRIQDIEREFLNSGKNMVTSVVDINKTVCTEFGLVMYLADDKSRDLLNRVEVTSI